ncbi:MAG: hypothetical protein SFV23_18655 [Planctomycetaceae bacterium]|nr:hypothetical protein [Planctomycetaceae bacterium]
MSPCVRATQCLCMSMVMCLTGPAARGAEDVSPTVAGHLQQGHVAAAETYLKSRLLAESTNSQARFALGVVQVLSAIEKLGQDQYRYGAFNGSVRTLPVLRLPVPVNPQPEPVTYQQVRQVFADFQSRLIAAEAELAKVDLKQEVKLPLDLLSLRLDLTGDGASGAKESFLEVLGVATRPRPGVPGTDMRVTFDAGDVPWLRGYCHFLAGFCDIVLAYDHQRLFDHTGQLLYPRHVSSQPIDEPLDLTQGQPMEFDRQILDFVAALHLVSLPLKEPGRMESARGHLLEMIRTSRESWALILAETDNDQEWLPNPRQAGVLGIPVTREVVDGWHGVLAEMEDLLEGRKLVPFWRDYARFLGGSRPVPAEGRGVNLRRFFAEPRDFDLILLIQGTGALPYVERGTLSRPETWENLTRIFRGQFFGFAVWFN